MMKELSLSPKEFGLIGSSFFLLFSLTGMAVGLFVVGRFPTKWILIILAAVWSATQIPIFFTSSVAVERTIARFSRIATVTPVAAGAA